MTPMRKISGTRLSASMFEKHIFMCDLIHLEGSLLSLFRDQKQNWLYLWCDTDTVEKERWLIFSISRSDLVSYLQKNESLKDLVCGNGPRYFLDYTHRVSVEESPGVEVIKASHRTLHRANDILAYSEYIPADDSYFDPLLAPNISLAHELNPTTFDVPIDGEWFVNDLDNFSNVYTQLYSFFYCSKPQFITDIGHKVERFLKSPWVGGFSRINFFEALHKFVPSLHDLKIKQMRYASPGEITIEAMASIGALVNEAILRYLDKERDILRSAKVIDSFLTSSKLKKVDLSASNDDKLDLTAKELEFLHGEIADLIADLGIQSEWGEVVSRSPNVIVSSKVLLALVNRVSRLAEFQKSGLFDLTRL